MENLIQLVNSSGSIVEFDNSNCIYNTGGTSHIFKVDESTLLKIHHLSYGKSLSTLKKEVFDLLKTIKHENFIKLIERYNRIPQTSENVEAYTYEHIRGDSYNLLYLRTDFMIDQFNGIQNLFGIFTSEGIIVFDVAPENSIVLADRVVVIDPDFYTIYDDSEARILINNACFCQLMEGYFETCNDRIRKDLFSKISEEKDPVLALEKRLKGCKRPIDYFINR